MLTPLAFTIDVSNLSHHITDAIKSMNFAFYIPAALLIFVVAYTCIIAYSIGNKRGELGNPKTDYSLKQERAAMKKRTMPGSYTPGKPLYFQIMTHYHKNKEGGI